MTLEQGKDQKAQKHNVAEQAGGGWFGLTRLMQKKAHQGDPICPVKTFDLTFRLGSVQGQNIRRALKCPKPLSHIVIHGLPPLSRPWLGVRLERGYVVKERVVHITGPGGTASSACAGRCTRGRADGVIKTQKYNKPHMQAFFLIASIPPPCVMRDVCLSRRVIYLGRTAKQGGETQDLGASIVAGADRALFRDCRPEAPVGGLPCPRLPPSPVRVLCSAREGRGGKGVLRRDRGLPG
ncbi:hypothetical protein Bbelb_294130 [Branchiostoma belcheri]|nr:hypothetical protein Bbelb_294130 [Branchiostoma belcheri]